MSMSALALRDAVLRRYADGDRSFRGEDLDVGVLDLRNANLAAADFSEAFIFADFRGANLAHCRFDGANVKTCDFRGAHLFGASFAGAAIDGATFDAIGAAAADFAGATEQGHVYSKGDKPHAV